MIVFISLQSHILSESILQKQAENAQDDNSLLLCNFIDKVRVCRFCILALIRNYIGIALLTHNVNSSTLQYCELYNLVHTLMCIHCSAY